MGSVSWRKRGNRYQVSWRLDDGSQGGKTVDTPDEARDLAAEKRLEMRRGTWRGRHRGRLPFTPGRPSGGRLWSADDPQPHHARRHREPAAAARAPLVRRPPHRQDHPGRRAPLANQLARNARPRQPVACRSLAAAASSSSPRTKAPSTPTRSARCPAQAPGRPRTGLRRRPSGAPSPPRKPAGCWPVSRCSGGITCSPCSAPACASASWPACAAAGSTSTGPCPCSRSVDPLPGRPVRQRLQATPQERRRHPPGPPRPPGGRGDPPPAPSRHRPRRAGVHRPRAAATTWPPGPGPCCPATASAACTRPRSSAPTSTTSSSAAPTTSGTPSRPGWRTPASRPGSSTNSWATSGSRHGDLDGGSRIGARYRHTTDEMAARVVDAIEARLQKF